MIRWSSPSSSPVSPSSRSARWWKRAPIPRRPRATATCAWPRESSPMATRCSVPRWSGGVSGKPRSGACRCCPKATISGVRSCARRPAAACTSVSRPGSTVSPATAANCAPSMAHACRWTWSCARATNCYGAAPSAAVRRSPPPVRRWPNACRPARASRSGWRYGWRRRPASCCVWSARASTWCAAANTRWRWSDRWRASPAGTSCSLARKAAIRHATVPSTT